MQRWLLPTLLPFPSILLNVAETWHRQRSNQQAAQSKNKMNK
jgi:hypothetical protein